METFDLHLGAPVHCEDGEAGKLAAVVTDARGRQAVALIVEKGIPLVSKEARVIPRKMVRGTQEGIIWLSIPKDRLADYAEYREAVIEVPDPTATAGRIVTGPDGGYGAVSTPTIRQRQRQGVMENQLVIRSKTAVNTLHHSIGHVDHLLVNPEDGAITHVVVRKGLLRSAYAVVPAEAIEEVSDGSILLSMTNQEVGDLPSSIA